MLTETRAAEELARVKRFLELFTADADLRARLRHDTAAAVAALGLEVDAEAVRPLWDETATECPPIVQRYRDFLGERLALRDRFRDAGTPQHDGMRIWRERQMARCRWELAAPSTHAIIHAPMAIELARGCSVGCWFCGVGAGKLTEVWPYQGNQELWRGMLRALEELLGTAAAQGFCYWATDPMDNPDYEAFCDDFAAVFGRWPQTTTALPLKNVARTHELLRRSRGSGCPLNRFSVLTLSQLRRIYEAFTPLQLLDVELVLQNSQSTLIKAYAGKARDKAGAAPSEQLGTATIACVSGFLINAVERTISLISPCAASDQWPLGYRTHARAGYRDAAEFRSVLLDMLSDKYMPHRLSIDQPARLASLIRWEPRTDGFHLASAFTEGNFTNHKYPPMARLGELLAGGASTVGEVAWELQTEATMPMTLLVLEEMHRLGALDEDLQRP